MYSVPRVIILKEGTDTSQGKGQLISNINACEVSFRLQNFSVSRDSHEKQAITDILKTTLGPRGKDKLIHDGGHVTITNDGATIIKLCAVYCVVLFGLCFCVFVLF